MENILKSIKEQKSVMPGQIDMFGTLMGKDTPMDDNFPDCEEFASKDILAMEKECIGMYVSGHPMNQYRKEAEACATARIYEIAENEEHRFNIGSKVTLAGIINHVRTQLTKKGEMMKYLELEDLTGTIEVLVFPSLVRRFDSLLQEDAIVAVEGNLDMTEDAPPKLRLENIQPLSEATSKPNTEAKLYLRVLQSRDEDAVKAILRGGKGEIPVILRLEETKQTLMAGKGMWISPGDGRQEKLVHLLGEENVKLVMQ